MNRVALLSLLSIFTLAGCNAANVQPEASSPAGPSSAAQQAGSPPDTLDQSAQFDQLNGRITLLQEQFLELKVQNSSVAERVQLLLTQFQVLAQEVKRSAVEKPQAAEPDPGLSDMMQRLDQQLTELQQIAPELGGGDPFKLASCYTAKGQWVMIRYNRFSGESWISAANSWQPLEEEQTPSISSYDIQLLPANSDVKGYVAARIDHNSGDSWWLNQQTWVKYQQ
ncbi:hypothetical protein SAMN03080615_01552 [Amphritea atlantica]|uniref:Uncharacterized protein n=1 Tax=Amphritea atlantica TaxID=355243 RepID=A0A1H9G0Y0_9GAMM|nr:hypothetical protein [Amphritea atlantica]SEQ43747.1 hypothetical protein SAMN03080615_01552 [Amphritea atlantica]